MEYCTRCVYPSITVNLNVGEGGVCSSCDIFHKKNQISEEFWKKRKDKFVEVLQEVSNKNPSNYDCIVPVSGGKDSYYQTHVIAKEYGLKPLLVTYHGNNYLPEGDYNRDQMRHKFDVDHLVFGPSVEVLKKLNRICFKKMGDMNWHAHCGINTYPIQIAVKFGISLLIWGETSWDISGMYEPDDFVEFNARVRHEHDLRGYEWYDMLDDKDDPLTEKDVLWAKYPTDAEILKVGVRGLYIGNFLNWDANRQSKMMVEKHDWKPAQKPFQRTYRNFSNLDDRYENGAHDLLKFIKFGYGRASDHASKDIRDGYMTREEGIEMVRKYDSVVSDDLYYWLEYVDMTEKEFWQIADTFRDPHVWRIEDGEWVKDNIWGEPSAYGPVHLSPEQIKEYQKRCKELEV